MCAHIRQTWKDTFWCRSSFELIYTSFFVVLHVHKKKYILFLVNDVDDDIVLCTMQQEHFLLIIHEGKRDLLFWFLVTVVVVIVLPYMSPSTLPVAGSISIL